MHRRSHELIEDFPTELIASRARTIKSKTSARGSWYLPDGLVPYHSVDGRITLNKV